MNHQKSFRIFLKKDSFLSPPPARCCFRGRQATAKVRSEAANSLVSRPGRLRTSQIPMALSVSSAVTPPRHHVPALPSKVGELRQNQY